MFFLFDLKVFHLSLGLNLNIQTNFEKFQISKCFKKFILIYPNLTSVQIQFKSISNLRFLNLKSCLKFKKKRKGLCYSLLGFQPISSLGPFSSLLHSHRNCPLRSAFWPCTTAPTSSFHQHRRPSGHAAVPCAADYRPPPCTKSQTDAPSCRLHFPHRIGTVVSPFPPLTPSKPMRRKTPPPPTASPPPHRLPGPIKCTPASGSLHRTRYSPPSLFSASPVARHQAPTPPSPPLHRRPHPAFAPVTKARGKD
jgi:hypothetical protein